MRRMDRYNDGSNTIEKRSSKNAELYQDVSNNTKHIKKKLSITFEL